MVSFEANWADTVSGRQCTVKIVGFAEDHGSRPFVEGMLGSDL